jgi:poly(3-hydroxyalkanoate) synthetase
MDKADRLLADDITVYDLRRIVVVRKGEPPNVSDYLAIAEGRTTAAVYAWCVEREVNEEPWWFLWIVWKETRNGK